MFVTSRLASAVKVAAINAVILGALLIPVELVFGTWLRPMGPSDLKRFSIPLDVQFEFDSSKLYGGVEPKTIHYTRDAYGFRGSYRSLADIDVLTVGGSTTEQRYIDDHSTWQAIAETRLRDAGIPLVLANAGVDGQSTVGHLFNFEYWFPALKELKPAVVLFYVGANDTLRHERRPEFDATVNADAWKHRSATYQLLRTVSNNMRARAVGVYHGRRRPVSDDAFTSQGLIGEAERNAMSETLNAGFLRNVRVLVEHVRAMGAQPVFMTQTAFGWSANPDSRPLGLTDTITIFGSKVNYADVSFLHQSLNRRLVEYCRESGVTCLDLASDVTFGPDDYYDFLHNTPAGAAKIGEYLAMKLQQLPIAHRSTR